MIPLYDIELSQLYKVAYAINPIDRKSAFFFHSPFAFQTRQFVSIECFHSRGQHLCKFIGTKESVYIRKEFNSQRIGLGHQHGRHFIVLGHQYGRRDVM